MTKAIVSSIMTFYSQLSDTHKKSVIKKIREESPQLFDEVKAKGEKKEERKKYDFFEARKEVTTKESVPLEVVAGYLGTTFYVARNYGAVYDFLGMRAKHIKGSQFLYDSNDLRIIKAYMVKMDYSFKEFMSHADMRENKEDEDVVYSHFLTWDDIYHELEVETKDFNGLGDSYVIDIDEVEMNVGIQKKEDDLDFLIK